MISNHPLPTMSTFQHPQAIKNAVEITLSGETMGTTYRVIFPSADSADSDAQAWQPMLYYQLQKQIAARLQTIIEQMSVYQSDSVISRFNRQQDTRKMTAISSDFATVIAKAQELHTLTQGGLNITLAPMIELWGFGANGQKTLLPTTQEIQQCAKRIGMQHLKLDMTNPAKPMLGKAIADLSIDVSAIAKGFAVDALAKLMRSFGMTDFLLEIGGEIYSQGKNSLGDTWQVAIEKPLPLDGSYGSDLMLVFPLDGMALATTGDYQDFYSDENGQTYAHIISSHTHRPLSNRQENMASLSVIAPDCMTADGLATGLYTLDTKSAIAIANAHHLAILIIARSTADQTANYTLYPSQAFDRYLLQWGIDLNAIFAG